MLNLKGKKILFIGIGFYDYEHIIKTELENNGAIVNYVISTVNLLFSRIMTRLGLNKYAKSLNNKTRYNLLKETANDYDIIFTIKGEDLNQADLELLKAKNPNAQWKLYLWDSIVRHYNLEILFKYFDNVWSFDRVDCVENPKLIFRPLFYRKKYSNTVQREYKLSFIGWMHSDRFELAKSMKNMLVESGEKYFIKLYIAPFSYFIARYITKVIKKQDLDLITTRPIEYYEYVNVTRNSDVILDISHPLQSGLTMRSIEALAAGCHLLTTNVDIRNYEDIPSISYTIMQSKASKIILHKQIDNLQFDMNKYSLTSFIGDIFN